MKLTKTTVKAEYRMPRERKGEASRVLVLTWDGMMALMIGGKYGSHVIYTEDVKRVKAHWEGYVSRNMGRTVKPSFVAFTETIDAPAEVPAAIFLIAGDFAEAQAIATMANARHATGSAGQFVAGTFRAVQAQGREAVVVGDLAPVKPLGWTSIDTSVEGSN